MSASVTPNSAIRTLKMTETSPAVERAQLAAQSLADARGQAVRLGDWLAGLLAEEWGKPAELVGKLGVDLDELVAKIAAGAGTSPIAPDPTTLMAQAREFGMVLRGEPTLTTDFLLLAAVGHDQGYHADLSKIGLDSARMAAALRSDPSAPEPPRVEPEPFSIPDAPPVLDAARIVDVNLNRARESLRVLDDYCRFILDDAFLTGRFKKLRHHLVEASRAIPPHLLLGARDTRQDVGTTLSGSGEYERASAAGVATTNVKRLQEALRSLEEFGKVLSVSFAAAVEAIRYEAYTLEKALERGAGAADKLACARLYVLLTGSQCTAALDWTIAEAADGGASIFQMREKDLSDRELLDRARTMRVWTRRAGALFIVNDRPDIAKLAEADGVHLGQDDLSVSAARRILGPDALIGVSTHNLEQVRTAILDGADYLGLGPTFPSTTKEFAEFPGLEFIRVATAETTLPTFALGGITLANAGEVAAAGAKRIAVGAAIARADDPQAIARGFARLFTI